MDVHGVPEKEACRARLSDCRQMVCWSAIRMRLVAAPTESLQVTVEGVIDATAAMS